MYKVFACLHLAKLEKRAGVGTFNILHLFSFISLLLRGIISTCGIMPFLGRNY